MTVNEFIQFVKDNNIPGDMQIMIDGYEGGITDIKAVRKEKVELGYWAELGMHGPHELVENVYHNPWDEKEIGLMIDCVYISRFES